MKTCPFTFPAASLARNTAMAAIGAGVIALIFSTRAAWAGSSEGMEPIMRLQANGAMQLERTL
ncbi:hypothetical protein D3C76_1545230 [compost metagenome]